MPHFWIPVGQRQRRWAVFYMPTVWNFTDLTALIYEKFSPLQECLGRRGWGEKENICEMSLKLDKLKSTCALLLNVYEHFICASRFMSEHRHRHWKMITHIVKILVHSLAQYHSVPTSMLENNFPACSGN